MSEDSFLVVPIPSFLGRLSWTRRALLDEFPLFPWLSPAGLLPPAIFMLLWPQILQVSRTPPKMHRDNRSIINLRDACIRPSHDDSEICEHVATWNDTGQLAAHFAWLDSHMAMFILAF
ncbi:hypothetical protein CC2G_000291 [Coprinopsis cinerea AmutBmut pab1-1]|nr:hypothetical protein CC2G_000291 [Coprinopsis cinerea AmutBmut pab1-1]